MNILEWIMVMVLKFFLYGFIGVFWGGVKVFGFFFVLGWGVVCFLGGRVVYGFLLFIGFD